MASYSGIMMYERCPKSYEHKYILKTPDLRPKSEAMARGTTIHNALENFLLKKQDHLHHEIQAKHGARYRAIRDTCKVWPERKFAFTDAWEECDFDASDAAIRGVIDLLYQDANDTVHVHEFKTGKEYEEHAQQKALYGLVTLLLFPSQTSVEVTGVYLDLNKYIPATFNRSLMFAYKDTWEKRLAKLQLPIFNTRPGFYCKWCAYSKKNGGPCEF